MVVEKCSCRKILCRKICFDAIERSVTYLLSFDKTSTLGGDENTDAIKRSLIHLLSCYKTSTLGSNENTDAIKSSETADVGHLGMLNVKQQTVFVP